MQCQFPKTTRRVAHIAPQLWAYFSCGIKGVLVEFSLKRESNGRICVIFLFSRNYLEECYIEDWCVIIDELKQENFENVAVLKIWLGSWFFFVGQPQSNLTVELKKIRRKKCEWTLSIWMDFLKKILLSHRSSYNNLPHLKQQ